MPHMDGYDVLRALRRLPDGDHPKVLFCTIESASATRKPRPSMIRRATLRITAESSTIRNVLIRPWEVMKLANDTYEPNPVHLDTRWRAVSRGVHRLDGPRGRPRLPPPGSPGPR
jgi:CheY-like chemotaxis protein